MRVTEAQFAAIDALIAEAEEAAAALPPLPGSADGALTEEERREVRAAMDLVHGADGPNGPGGRPGAAV
ncbi:hypothetical protein AB0P17_34845 [Streptomyces sp. NPDC088124]|uniref:hypothetical protein n=1 Tax=Streptomyces sp. NPDC088124 TaxID=3154654 RepID=UPI003438104D